MNRKVVLVTGAGSGIGQATATLLADGGYRVFGTSRDGAGPAGAPYAMLPLELSSDESARHCVGSVLDEAGRIDVLFNNAGFGVIGAIEETRLDQAQAQMEVFLFGVHRMIRAVLPSMRARRSGQIINMSSSAATLAVPFAGLYSAGKQAMAGYTAALRQEVRGFGIAVCYLEATAIRTEAAEEAMIAADRIEAYEPLRDRAIRDFRDAIREGRDPAIVARAVRRIVETRDPRLVYRVDGKAKLLPILKAVAPARLWDTVFDAYRRARGGTAGGR
jgi:NAD(P)-dependent dehydrogenase (short-subunit alcohol dehydrogenase family)